MKLRKGLSMTICGDCMSWSAFLSEKHRVEGQVRKPMEETIQLRLPAHNTIVRQSESFQPILTGK